MLTLILQRPSWKHLFTSLTVVKLILGFLVAASTSNAFIERGGLEVGKSLKASIKHPVICLCVTGNRCLVPDVRRSIASAISSMQISARPVTLALQRGIQAFTAPPASQSELQDCGCPAKQASGESLCCLFELSVVKQEAKERGKSNLRTAD